ncbi:TonB-dependent receptor [Larkinella harenae]
MAVSVRKSRLAQSVSYVLIVVGMLLTQTVFAQGNVLDRKITLQLNQVSVADALRALEEQTGSTFVYSSTLLNSDRKVNASFRNQPLRDVLKELLGDVARGIQVQGNRIHIKPTKGERKGNLKGAIQTSDGQPASYVTVSVKGTGKGMTTDEQGHFLLRNVPAGPQTVVVQLIGYTSVEQTVEVPEDETVTLPGISIREDSKTLQEVLVRASTNKFADKESESVARMPLKNLENPQVYNVISKELLNQQMVVDYHDALKTSPGVVPFISAAGTNIAYIRGFSVQARVRNGLASQTWTLVDPVNLERVEVIKGPSGTLFGASMVSYGAVTNRVTKKPFETFKGEVSYSVGGWDLSRLTVDVNTPLNPEKTVLLRVNAASHNEKSFQNFGANKSYVVAPSLSYKVNDRLTFLFDVELYKAAVIQQPYNWFTDGVSFRNLKALSGYYKNSIAGADAEGTKISNNAYAVATYTLSDKWTSSTSVSYSFNREADQFQLTAQWVNDTTIDRTFWKNLRRDFSTINIQQNFNGEFNLGSIRNRALIGADLAYNTDNRFVVEDPTYDIINPRKPFAPFYKDKADAIVANSTIQYSSGSWATYGAYVSNVSNLTDRLLLMLSLRMDYFVRNNSRYNGASENNHFQQVAFSPKLGVVYQVVKDQVSLFANYLNGFNNLGPITQPNGSVLNLRPQQANQWEGGIKAETFSKKVSATLSYYDITVSNSTRTDANLFIVQDATQHSRGLDGEVIANPVRGLNITAGYAYNRNTYTKANESVQGKTVTSAPRNVFNTWVSYKHNGRIFNNVGLGAGANFVDESFYDSANLFIIPSYTVYNATVFYETSKWRLGLKINNLTDQKSWNAWGYPQPLRQFIGNITFKF